MGTSKLMNAGWVLVALVLAAESLLLVWATIGTLQGVITDAGNPLLEEYRPSVLSQGIAILLVMVLAALWLVITLVGAVRRRPWARASTLTAQVLVVAAATGVLQGIMGTPGLGATLLFLGILGLAGVFMSRPRREETAE